MGTLPPRPADLDAEACLGCERHAECLQMSNLCYRRHPTALVGGSHSESRAPEWLTVVMAEYQAMRAETIAALQHQHSALSFGIATLGLLVAAASLTRKDQPDAAGLTFLLAVPVASALVLVVWLAEHIRLVRLRIFLLELSQRVNTELGREGLCWEQWLVEETDRSFRPDLAKLQGYAVIPLFLLVATGSALLGAVTLVESNALSPEVAYGLFGFVCVLALAYLGGYLRLSARIRKEREKHAIECGPSPTRVV